MAEGWGTGIWRNSIPGWWNRQFMAAHELFVGFFPLCNYLVKRQTGTETLD